MGIGYVRIHIRKKGREGEKGVKKIDREKKK